MQEHTSVLNGKETTTKHPVAYVSGSVSWQSVKLGLL